MRALILLLLLLGGCALIEPEPDIATPEEEAAVHPDFYDRGGNACWRIDDLVWCEDGYGSWLDNEENK
jgi:hypothetical protein